MKTRKIEAMHRRFGESEGLTCKCFKHLISGRYHDKVYHKCELYGMTHSEATDWRLSYTACGMYNMHVKRSTWVPVIETIIHAPHIPEPPLEGQITLAEI